MTDGVAGDAASSSLEAAGVTGGDSASLETGGVSFKSAGETSGSTVGLLMDGIAVDGLACGVFKVLFFSIAILGFFCVRGSATFKGASCMLRSAIHGKSPVLS